MIAEATLVAHSIVITVRLFAPVLSILLQQKIRVVNIHLLKGRNQRTAHQDVVDVLPFTLIFIGGLCPVMSHGTLRDVMQPLTVEILQQRVVIPVVEVSRYDDSRLGMEAADGINGGYQAFAYYPAVRARLTFTPETTGRMDYEYMERITADRLTAGIQNVARWAHARERLHPEGIAPNETERSGGVE